MNRSVPFASRRFMLRGLPEFRVHHTLLLMNEEHDSMLWAELKIPARIDVPTVARILGFAEHDIPILIRFGHLKPLGNPAPNASKWFSSVEILKVGTNREWLDKATKRLSQYWLHKRMLARDKENQSTRLNTLEVPP